MIFFLRKPSFVKNSIDNDNKLDFCLEFFSNTKTFPRLDINKYDFFFSLYHYVII